MLGDGRAILIGEHISPYDKRYDIQFKGSGITPYSRTGDGRAALKPMIREYLISEAMFSLNIPTSRSLCVVATGENINREKLLPGAILTRVASSHIRIGTFQYAYLKNDHSLLKELFNYTLRRHYDHINKNNNVVLEFLYEVMIKQIDLVINWMRVGFVHGVMNTDNIALSGETIDYGPCAFMNTYNPKTVFSSIDYMGRYSLGFIIGILADGFDRLQLVPLLIITPLTFLGGSFYSVEMLPEFWQNISYANPILYLISGFRWSFYEISDVSLGVSITFVTIFLLSCLLTIYYIFKTGYRLRN
jgi:uncharacterized protein YdiU (UPF0061 family)